MRKNIFSKLFIIVMLIMSFSGQVHAWFGMETPSLHVDGRYLKDPSGKNVILHGFMQPNDGYFNAQLFSNPKNYTPEECATPLYILKKQAEMLTNTSPQFGRTHGWYQSFVRIAAPGVNLTPAELADIDNSVKFDNAWKNMYEPYIEYCRSRGLYVVLIGSISSDSDDATTEVYGRFMGAKYRENMIKYWANIANRPKIKNADNVMFEICNEPVVVESSLGNGDWGNDTRPECLQAFQFYMQGICDAIRGKGADNVIWVPGLVWQFHLKQFVNYPIFGTNIGYSGHWYPIGQNDPTTIINTFNSDWKLCSDLYPVMVTEGSWHTMGPDQGLRTATTDGWGITTKMLFDKAGNISWMTGMNTEVIGGMETGRGPEYWTYPDINCGRDSFEWWRSYTWAAPGKIDPANPADPVNGLSCKYYEGSWDVMPDFDLLTPVAYDLCSNFDVSAPLTDDYFGYVFNGYINIPTDGTYTFYTTSDDGSKLYIGPLVVVNNDGLHGMIEASGQLAMKAGYHPIKVAMFDKTQGSGLEVRWEGPGIAKSIIPDSVLYRDLTAPAAPSGMMATPDDGKVWLNWNDCTESDLIGYNVYRSTISGSEYIKVNGSLPVAYLSISEFVDTTVVNGTTYKYVVTAIDTSGNESVNSSEISNVLPVKAGGSGSILREWWSGISGSAVSNLTSNSNYPNNRSGANEISSLESPTNFADNFGERLRGFIHPSYNGSYTFWIAGDDNCELWLSTNENPANKVRIASVTGWTDPRQWDKFTQQKSSPITLVGGLKYYIEVLHKEGSGGDNLAVAWQRAGMAREIIPGSYLSPWPPVSPKGLVANRVSAIQNNLTWTASPGAERYIVKRSTVSGGPYTMVASNVTGTSYSDTGLASDAFYFYVVSAVIGTDQSADSVEAVMTMNKLNGTVIGTTGSWNNNPAVGRQAAFDGDIATYFDSNLSSGGWTGLDLGKETLITEIRYVPRAGSQFPGRMVGGSFQASSTPDFSSNVVTLFTIVNTPSDGVYAKQAISGVTPYRYVRYYGPSNSNCNVAEIEFYGFASQVAEIPTNLVAEKVSSTRTHLSWRACSGASSYVIKRSATSGGPYTVIATDVINADFTDKNAPDGRSYYVVRAVYPSEQSSDSNEAATLMRHIYLKLDETTGTTAADATGNGQVGTLINGPLWSTGKYKNAVDLDGTDDYISLPAGVVSSLTEFTISTWVYLDAASQWSRVFDFGSGTATNMFLTPIGGSSVVRFALKPNNTIGEQIINGTAALPTGVWTHVAVTLSGSTGILYVNGVEVGRNIAMTATPSAMGNTTQNYIGKSQYADPYLNGKVDDFRIYSNALRAHEVAALAAKTSLNEAPYFINNPTTCPTAVELKSYTSAYLASAVVDSDNDPLTYTKVSGPAWLAVAADGTLSGTPNQSDVGVNSFTIKVQDAQGLYDAAVVKVPVADVYSGSHGMSDLEGLVSRWLMSGCTDTPSCGGADLNGDGKVDMSDFAILTGNWLADSLQFNLKLDETSGTNAADSSYYNNPGTLINGPVWTTGKLGGALSFDGVDDYVVSEYQGIAGTNPRTVCAWVKADADPTNAQKNLYSVVSWGGNVTNGMAKWFVAIDDQTGQLAVGIYGSRIKGGMSLEDGQWHHVAAVLPDGATNINQIKLYVDGTEVDTNASTLNATINTAFSEVSIGSINNSTTPGVYTVNHPFRGSIDDVRIYSRALSANELSELAK